MLCNNCGKEIPKGSSLCLFCGKSPGLIQNENTLPMSDYNKSSNTIYAEKSNSLKNDGMNARNFSTANIVLIVLCIFSIFTALLLSTNLDFLYRDSPTLNTLDILSCNKALEECDFSSACAIWLIKYVMQAGIVIISFSLLFLITKKSAVINHKNKLFIYMLPITIIIIIYKAIPVVLNFILSIKGNTHTLIYMFNGKIVDLDNFKAVISSDNFLNAFQSSVFYALLLVAAIGIMTLLLFLSIKCISNSILLTIYCMLSLIPISVPKATLSNIIYLALGKNEELTYLVFMFIQLSGIILCILGYLKLKQKPELNTSNKVIKKRLAYILPSIYSVIPIYIIIKLVTYLFMETTIDQQYFMKFLPSYFLLTLFSVVTGLVVMVLIAYPLIHHN